MAALALGSLVGFIQGSTAGVPLFTVNLSKVRATVPTSHRVARTPRAAPVFRTRCGISDTAARRRAPACLANFATALCRLDGGGRHDHKSALIDDGGDNVGPHPRRKGVLVAQANAVGGNLPPTAGSEPIPAAPLRLAVGCRRCCPETPCCHRRRACGRVVAGGHDPGCRPVAGLRGYACRQPCVFLSRYGVPPKRTPSCNSRATLKAINARAGTRRALHAGPAALRAVLRYSAPLSNLRRTRRGRD